MKKYIVCALLAVSLYPYTSSLFDDPYVHTHAGTHKIDAYMVEEALEKHAAYAQDVEAFKVDGAEYEVEAYDWLLDR